MIDIVNSLRARNEFVAQTAADEIETLRQRVKELEQQNEMLVNRMAHISCVNGLLRADSDELATLKQAQEPVEWHVSPLGGLHVVSANHIQKYLFGLNDELLANALCRALNDANLYTSAPTIPEGWQLVPTKANKNMQHTFIDTYNAYGFESAYRDLLSAAPKPGEPA